MDSVETDSPFGGTGNYQNLGDAVAWLRVIDPRSVLDVGCGFGRWGFLCREFLDVWNGRVYRRDWQVRLIGVDAFESNLKDHHRLIYDEVHGVEVQKFFAERSDRFDLIILGDVLEHFPKLEGLDLLAKCLERASYVLLILPIGNQWPQQAIYDNPYERHLGVWEEEDVLRLNPLVACCYRDYIDRPYLGAVLSTGDSKSLKQKLVEATPSISSRPLPLRAVKALPPKTIESGANGHAGQRKLHVALVTVEYPPLFGGGIATYAFHAARMLGEAGHRVTVFTRAWEGETPQLKNVHVCPVVEEPGPNLPKWELNWLVQNLRRGEAISRRLSEVHAEHPIDVIEVTDYYHEGLFLDTSKLLDADGSPVPVVMQFHGPRCVIAGLDGVLPAALLQAAEQLALADCEFAKTYSVLMRDQANQLWPGVGCEYVPATFHPSDLPPPVQAGKFEFDLLYFGKVELRKGMVPLAKAIQELMRRGIQPSICFVGRDTDTAPGGGSMTEWLERELRPLLGSRLHFRDAVPQDQLWQLLAKARLIVIPSLWESLGFAAWEAFCSGRPVICSSRVAAAGVLDEALSRQMVVDVDDVPGFADTVARLLQAPARELDALAAKARSAVLEACRPDRIHRLTVEFYHRCIERARADRGRQAWRNHILRCRDLLLEAIRLFGEGYRQEIQRFDDSSQSQREYINQLEEARTQLASAIDVVRARNAELEQARDQLDGDIREARSAWQADARKLRARIAELEAAQGHPGNATGDQADASEAAMAQFAPQPAESGTPEQAQRRLGLKLAAVRAEAEYLREEFGAARWKLEGELKSAHASLSEARQCLAETQAWLSTREGLLAETHSALDGTRARLAEAEREVARLHEAIWRIEHTLTFRVRRLGGRVLRRLGLRKPTADR